MGSKIEKLFLLSLVVVSLLVQSSTSSPLQNDLLETLMIRLDSLQNRVDFLEVRNSKNEAKIDLLEAKNAQQEEEIIKLKAKKAERLESDHLPTPFNVKRSFHSTDNRMGSFSRSATKAVGPPSCIELSVIGHSLDGLYLIQNPETNQIQTVFCTFGTSGVTQDFIGNVDIKTTSVHFYAQKTASFRNAGVIPFEVAPGNDGEAMDLPSGVFTAPVPGLYHFQFSATKDTSINLLSVYLQVNGVDVGLANTNQFGMGTSDSVSLSASLRLAANDRVTLRNAASSGLIDGSAQFTHFTGWLVEEELI